MNKQSQFLNLDPTDFQLELSALGWNFDGPLAGKPKKIDEDGGRIILQYNNSTIAKLIVPPDAVGEETTFNLTVPDRNGSKIVHIEITATRLKNPLNPNSQYPVTEFDRPLVLMLRYHSTPGAEGEVGIYESDPEKLRPTPKTPLGGIHKKKHQTVQTHISHLSGYILAQGIILGRHGRRDGEDEDEYELAPPLPGDEVDAPDVDPVGDEPSPADDGKP